MLQLYDISFWPGCLSRCVAAIHGSVVYGVSYNSNLPQQLYYMLLSTPVTIYILVQRWPPCNEELLRNFKWDAVQPAAQAEPEADLSLSGRTRDVDHGSSLDQVTSQATGPQHTGHNASSGGQLSGSQEQSSFAGILSPAGHLY